MIELKFKQNHSQSGEIKLFLKMSTSNETVKNQIKDKIKNSFEALGEYIWNSIDAHSTEIKIEIDNIGTNLRKIIIEDNGSGINYDEIRRDFTLSDSPKALKHKDYLSLPHGKNGLGRFAFIKFAHQVNWETTYSSPEGKFTYEISIDGNALNDVQKVKDKQASTKSTGTILKIIRIDNDQDLIKDNKKPLEAIENYIIQEFYAIMSLYNVKITLNNKILDITKLIKKRTDKQLLLGNKKFDVTLINWSKGFCKDFKYYFLNSSNEEIYHIKSPISRYDDCFLHSVYIKSSLFNDFCPASEKKRDTENQQALLDKDSFDTYNKLVDSLNKFVNKIREPLTEDLANKAIDQLEKGGYFNQILTTKFDKDVRKPFVKDTTKAIIKFAPKILGGLSKDQTLVFLNLINRLIDDDKYLLLDILKILLREENRNSLEDLKKILDRYKLSEITLLLHEVEQRLEIIEKLDKMHHSGKNKDFIEKDLQNILNIHYWVFGDNYNSLICSEEDTMTKMRDLYVKHILKDSNKYSDPVSKKQVDLFLHGYLEVDKLHKNLIVEIKKPSLRLTKEIYHEQLVGYAELIRKRPEFQDPKKNEWHFILIGYDFADDFFLTHYKKDTEYLMEEIESANMRLYVMRWTDILSELSLKYKFLKDNLTKRKEKFVENQ